MNRKYLNIIVIVLSYCLICYSCEKQADAAGPQSNGEGGSMAKITIVNNYLYSIDSESLRVFSIDNTEDPVYVKEINIGFGIETIFPSDDFLYIGSTSGMFIYDITQPDNPVYIGDFAHVQSCDPVVVDSNLAFVTLRGGTDCRLSGAQNQLDILNISDKENPALLASHFMDDPHGLDVDEEYIFICHGVSGFGVYKYDEYYNIDTVARVQGLETYDVILRDKKALIVGPTGFYQYDYSNLDSIYLVSELLLTN